MQTDNKNTPSKIWFRSLNRYELTKVCIKYKVKEGQPLTDEQIETIYLAEQPIKEDTLTKDEAIEAMLKGYKVTHQYFTDSEWAKLNGHFEIEFEDGCKIKVDDFWRDRKGEEWQMGWSIFAEPIKEQSSNREEGDMKAKWYLIPTSFKPVGELRDIIIAEMDISVTNEVREENQALRESNTRLKKRIEVMESVLNECYSYFSAPNFTDRYGTADRIKKALHNNNPK